LVENKLQLTVYHRPVRVHSAGNKRVFSWRNIYDAIVSINLNLAYREINSNSIFSTDIASSRGKRKLSKFKKLVVMETFAAAIVSALAVSIWSKQSFILLL